MPNLISVIVTTYNRADALDAVLAALAGQNERGFEVVIADDGSGPDDRGGGAALANATAPCRLAMSGSADFGFRAAEIRNRAILAAGGDYCVFLDGDCIARPDFVAAHRRLAQPGWFVTGNRVLLSKRLTFGRSAGPAARELDRPAMDRASPARRCYRLSTLPRLPLGRLRGLATGRWAGARSCNLAIWRTDLDRVNGFDASFRGWGREDSDLLIRLLARACAAGTVALRPASSTYGSQDADRAELADE